MQMMHTMASQVIAAVPKRRFYEPKLKRQIVAESLAPGASVAIGRNNWLFAGSLRAGQARRCGDEPNSLCQTQRA